MLLYGVTRPHELTLSHGPLARYVKLWVAHALGTPGTFSLSLRVSDPDMHHGTCVTHVLWRMLGLLTSGILWSRWQGKRSRHSRHMRNQQFYLSGKRPIVYPVLARFIWALSHIVTSATFQLYSIVQFSVKTDIGNPNKKSPPSSILVQYSINLSIQLDICMIYTSPAMGLGMMPVFYVRHDLMF